MNDPRIAPPRSLEELKSEVVLRNATGGYPGHGVRPFDAERAMARLSSLDPDDWAQTWIDTAESILEEAELATELEVKRSLFRTAYSTFTMGRFPAPTTELKRTAYARSLEAYFRYEALLPERLEVVRIPFEGKEIIGYFRRPETVERFPLIIQCGGLDYLKEQIADEALGYLPHGFCVFAMDMPGTGQSPIKADVGSERIFSAVLDWAETRPDIDSGKMFVRGVSWGGHWATRVAILEKDRLLGANNHGGPVHNFFQPEWQLKALGTREYLMGLFDARSAVFGVETLDEFLEYGPRMSLLKDDLIDQPSAPMLIVNGAQDSQVPIADHFLLLSRGDAKEAWINPKGGHMGGSQGWAPAKVAEQVLLPWLRRRIEQA
jgi:esterase FrsA